MQTTGLNRTGLDQGEAVGPQIYRILQDRIIRLDLLPGTRLSETEISTGFGVSRQPVREAFIKLAEDGLLEIRPQRGSYVRRISVAGVMSAQFVREAIEADIVRLVARAVDTRLLAQLEAMLQDQRRLVDADNSSQFVELDEQFHRALAEAAGQAPAWSVIEGLKTRMSRVRYLSARQFPRVKLVDQHAAVVAAIAAGDADGAEAAMRSHLREILNDLPAIADMRPEFFDQAGQSAPVKPSHQGE